MRRINTDIWGEPLTEYTYDNMRVGTTSLESSDFENIPPFVTSDLTFGSTYPNISKDCLYSGYLSEKFAFDQLIDTSIAYCACSNHNLSIADIGGFGTLPDAPANTAPIDVNNLPFYTDKSKPVPIQFFTYREYWRWKSAINNWSIVLNGGSLFNPYSTNKYGYINKQKIWYPTGTNDGSPDDANGLRSSNVMLFMTYYRDFGLRALFLVIYVKYYDGTLNGYGLPQNQGSMSLKNYESQTAEWKASHPIIGAWAQPHIRTNANGTYSTAGVDSGNGFAPDLSLSLRSNPAIRESNAEVLQASAFVFNSNRNYQLPLYGYVNENNSGTVQMSANAYGGMSEIGYPIMYGVHTGTVRQGTGSYSNQRYIWLESAWSESFSEYLRRSCAAYGLYFTDDAYDFDSSTRDADRWTDSNMCLGVVNSAGYTNGQYTKGAANTTANNYAWKSASQSPYDPTGYNAYIGQLQIRNFYIGEKKAKAAYVGDTQI